MKKACSQPSHQLQARTTKWRKNENYRHFTILIKRDVINFVT